jgi:hypothetical protein
MNILPDSTGGRLPRHWRDQVTKGADLSLIFQMTVIIQIANLAQERECVLSIVL